MTAYYVGTPHIELIDLANAHLELNFVQHADDGVVRIFMTGNFPDGTVYLLRRPGGFEHVRVLPDAVNEAVVNAMNWALEEYDRECAALEIEGVE